jgi:CBS domain-containing protein
MLLGDLLTGDLPAVEVGTTIKQAAEKMKKTNEHTFAVLDNKECVGILTVRQIVNRCVAEGLDPSIGRVGDIMSREVVCCYDNEDLADAAVAMETHEVSTILVKNQKNQPRGFVSLGDVMVGAAMWAPDEGRRMRSINAVLN